MIGPDIHGGGHPWHGLCTDGLLTLPTAATLAYPQPSGGDCFKLAVPGFTAPARTDAQAAADADAGYDWLGYALVSGDSATVSGLQVYGRPLGRMKWIWAVSASEKWLVDASALTVTGGTLAGDLTLTEFGLHRPDGSAAPTVTAAVSVSTGIPSAVKIKLLDLSEDGGTVLLGLYAYADGTFNGNAMKPTPEVGIKLVLESSGYTATASVGYAAVSGVGAVNLGGVLNSDGTVRRFRGNATSISGGKRASIDVTGVGTPAYIDVLSSYTATDITPADTIEYVAPAASTTRLAGSATCPEGGTHSYDFVASTPTLADAYAQMQAALASRQAEVTAAYFDVYANCGGPPDTPLLTNVIDAGVNHVRGGFSWSINLFEQTVVSGGNTYKWARYRLDETSTLYELVYDSGSNCFTGIASSSTGTSTQSSSDYVYYFRKTTIGSTGQIDYEYWTTQPSCANPQYLNAPDLGTPGSTAEYTYDIEAGFSAVIGGVTTALGTQSFTYSTPTQGNFSGLGLQMVQINYPDIGNADRLEVYYYNSSAPGTREAVACEVVFATPCAGVFGIALVNRLGGSAQPVNLYKFSKPDISTAAWAGWTDKTPHEYNATLHPVSNTLAIAGPAAGPASAICYV